MNFDELEKKGLETVNRISRYGRIIINESCTIYKGRMIINKAKIIGQKTIVEAKFFKNEKQKQIKNIIRKTIAKIIAEIEKKQNLDKLKEYINNNLKQTSKVFIVGHNRADLDSLGSSIGLYTLAKSLGKDAYIIVDDDITKMESGTRKLLRDMAKKNKEKDKKSPFIKKPVFSKTVDKDSMIFITDTSNRDRICISDSLNKVRNVAKSFSFSFISKLI